MTTQYEEEYEGYRPKFGVDNVGAYTYVVSDIIKLLHCNSADVYIGRFCSIAPGLVIMNGGNHPTNHISTYPIEYAFPEVTSLQGVIKRTGKIVIGNDVWIGHEVHILPSITICDGAIIGAYSVVTKDVPPYAIVAGNPATIKKYRFPEDIRNRLLKLAWWNWSKEKLRKSLTLLHSENVESFLNYYENNPVKYYTGEEQ